MTLSGDATLVLPEFDAPPADPIALLAEWFDAAVRREVREPFAMVLSTADAGRPSSRVVLFKHLQDGALVFAGSSSSRKGRELAANPFAAVNFHWRETLQQITVTGSVERLPAETSDELFAERPRAAQAAAMVSLQSAPLQDEDVLRAGVESLVESGVPLDRPHEWFGYRLVPDGIEFWQGRPDRLHRRLRYTRDEQGWTPERLQP
ncbi:phenazine biosynthesis protein [Lentzea aerocolonigenes]|uniref:Pyridoxamine 5'-phosphate oxidase n=1 Tax=Lentzea aerocolonigenes TaxID=68170 RepID=A0A0F0GX89_LENAE|nr:phenazine biosynthesis FMN-dependent oxidase PhzG [Lentzea aerocolonigenes]KJK46627.1 phenazine biosynthesis protein [Lentzea aerocolonigenes]